jgi:hypothetical protein
VLSLTPPTAVPSRKEPLTPQVGGWVDPRTRLNVLEKTMLFTSNVNQNQNVLANCNKNSHYAISQNSIRRSCLIQAGRGGWKERHYEPKSRLWIENALQGKQSCRFGIEKSYRLALESFNCSAGRTTQLIGREMFTIPVTRASSVHFSCFRKLFRKQSEW